GTTTTPARRIDGVAPPHNAAAGQRALNGGGRLFATTGHKTHTTRRAPCLAVSRNSFPPQGASRTLLTASSPPWTSTAAGPPSLRTPAELLHCDCNRTFGRSAQGRYAIGPI